MSATMFANTNINSINIHIVDIYTESQKSLTVKSRRSWRLQLEKCNH